MVHLKQITRENFRAVLWLKLNEDQQDYVASNAASLAEAWLCYDKARPFAVWDDTDGVVGFVMLDMKRGPERAEIWRLMIDAGHQGKGYGRQALEQVLDLLRQEGEKKELQINYVKGNDGAAHLYRSMGFAETGEMEGHEVVMLQSL